MSHAYCAGFDSHGLSLVRVSQVLHAQVASNWRLTRTAFASKESLVVSWMYKTVSASLESHVIRSKWNILAVRFSTTSIICTALGSKVRRSLMSCLFVTLANRHRGHVLARTVFGAQPVMLIIQSAGPDENALLCAP